MALIFSEEKRAFLAKKSKLFEIKASVSNSKMDISG